MPMGLTYLIFVANIAPNLRGCLADPRKVILIETRRLFDHGPVAENKNSYIKKVRTT